jgi:type 1 fimbria pilin
MRQSGKKGTRRYAPAGAAVALALALMPGGGQAKDNNLHFDGTLVADPCVLDPKTTEIEVPFGTIVDKYLYLNTRTHSEPFTINLIECDTRLGNSVVVTFRGTESRELPGLLALTGGPASGVAIGLETAGGQALPFNKPVPAMALSDGLTALQFQGYVQGEPTALKNHGIVRGDFKAVATFEIAYP